MPYYEVPSASSPRTLNSYQWTSVVAAGAVFFMTGLLLGSSELSHRVLTYTSVPAQATTSAGVPQRLPLYATRDHASEVSVGRRGALVGGVASAAMAMGGTPPAFARKEPVNRPDLLPEGPMVKVIDTTKLLTNSQLRDVNRDIDKIEKLYGVKLRVLTQVYPNTPGLAIKDYWGVDADTVVLVVDDSFPNLLHFNVGENVDLLAPNGRFWTGLENKYGVTKFYRKNGQDEAVLRTVEDILDGLTNSDQLGTSVL
jgi:hypothetical protein|uniref:TPM domain-containing protein n=1 Tax=Eutreptiella gymnastica TaxID=73025 RepID=A0A7S4C978_9EUGL|eukprot:CAMPEP_0174284882 /NCGR_PEP_ID=MMETSP0809-20121228/6960_1 /TAXON_ID=73025 ORGANISM="Eutreptiella gymnastica-like, Strain CCMP1594" /NCGR_SAMPLE_ID=MMETSP0809 /ASSEMBLY_ACC=CAM_ASM_000658 /LENGTH=254 /DNA_ID=CAMNT_0015380531 /DNA_START=23 /DNA_END=787 /DNA_ORIENTATION=+